jgi:hypothetical protein
MGTNQSIEEFISDCIQSRTAALKMVLESRQAYRRRFYHSECLWDSRRGGVELSEEDKIVGVSPSEIGFAVITTGSHPNHRSRFRVKASGENWLIQEVDSECGHCRLFGSSSDCSECGGTGWRSWKEQLKRHEQRDVSSARHDPDKESEGSLLRDPAIEQFMTDHFRERTAALKKEMEIFAEYAKRFYTPECNWTRWVVSVQASEAERIAHVMPTEMGAYVITSGFSPMRLRYHLRREGQEWLIREVDSECPVCCQQGRSADCFWCGGTIWEHKNTKGGLTDGKLTNRDVYPDPQEG